MLPLLQNLKEFDLVYSVNQNKTGSFSLHPEIRNMNCMVFFLDFFGTFWRFVYPFCLPRLIMGWTPQHDRALLDKMSVGEML